MVPLAINCVEAIPLRLSHSAAPKHPDTSFRRKPGEAKFSRTYLTYVRAAERVQRVWLHPGQQQHITDFFGSNILDPGVRRGDDAFFDKLLM
jgi:hypothetical protein